MAVAATHSVGRADLVGAFEEFNLADQQGGFIADKVFPVASVGLKSAKFPVITRESGTSLLPNVKIGIEGNYPLMTFVTEDKEYDCEERGVSIRLSDKQVTDLAKAYGIPVDEVAGKIIWHQIRLQYEKAVADAAFDAVTNFTGAQGNYTDVSGSAPWTTASSAILSSIQAAQEAVYEKTGMVPMDLAINYVNFNRLMRTTEIQNKLATTKDKTVQQIADSIAPLLGLTRIHVGKAVYNSVPLPGTFSAAKVWDNKYAQLFVNEPNGSLVAPRLGTTVMWTADAPQLVVLEEYRDEDTRADKMRARQNVDELVCDVLFGHLLKVAAS